MAVDRFMAQPPFTVGRPSGQATLEPEPGAAFADPRSLSRLWITRLCFVTWVGTASNGALTDTPQGCD